MTRKRPKAKQGKKAISLVRAEQKRARQQGLTSVWDSFHNRRGQLVKAAAYNVLMALDLRNEAADIWPWAEDRLPVDVDKKSLLIRAAALICSELDRLKYNEDRDREEGVAAANPAQPPAPEQPEPRRNPTFLDEDGNEAEIEF